MTASRYHRLTRLAFFVAATVLDGCSFQNKPSQASRSDGEALLRKLQDALGGATRIAAVRDFEETIRAEAWDSSGGSLGDVRKRTRWTRSPNVVRLDQIGPRGTYVLYFEGASESGWEILPDLRSPEVSGVRFPTNRVNYLSGVKRGQVTSEDIRINVGLQAQDLAAKPPDFAPDIPQR
jgi:hypothetical protein